jgi:hypothetical protein
VDTSKTIGQIIGDLTPPQLWGLLGAAVTVLSSAVGLGVWLGKPPTLPTPQKSDLVQCSKAADYPRGKWLISGEITAGDRDALAYNLRFTSTTKGTYETNEKGAKVGAFSLDDALDPNHRVIVTITDSTGYKATVDALVSDSGCSFEGEFDDSNHHKGRMTFFWFEPQHFWVRRDPSAN